MQPKCKHQRRSRSLATLHQVVTARCGLKRVGGQGQNRTADTKIFSLLLYRLSYLAKVLQRRRPSVGDVRNDVRLPSVGAARI